MTNWFVSILDWVFSWVGNYGWAVVVFTVIVKVCLLPLDVKSRRSMRAMSALNPQLEKLKERYKNDQEKLNRKTQELYKKNKVNPLAGCLPMLIQLPILYIMFAAMRNVAARMQMMQMYEWIKLNLTENQAGEALLAYDSEAVAAVLEQLRAGTMSFGDTQPWLWVKSVFQADNISKAIIPTLSEFTTTYNQYINKVGLDASVQALLKAYLDNTELANAVDGAISSYCSYRTIPIIFNIVSLKIPTNWGYVNGYYVLPILAGASQILSTKLQPTPADTPSANNQKGSTGKFMKWFFPIFSVWICLSSTAAFAIYWVFVNVWTIATSFGINKYLEFREKKSGLIQDDDTTQKKEALQP